MASRNLLAALAVLTIALCIAPAVLAEGLRAIAPADGASIEPKRDRLLYSIDVREEIHECRLLIDGTLTKTAPYPDEILFGKSLGFAAPLEAGTYTWKVECDTTAGVSYETETRTIVVGDESVVKVTSSGTTRGSMRREFTFRNSPDQKPVRVDKIASGDYIVVAMDIPPSKVKKEFYVRTRMTKDGKKSQWLTSGESDYYIFKGENTTIDVAGTTILFEGTDVEANKVIITAYPNVTGKAPTEPEEQEPGEEAPDEGTPTVEPDEQEETPPPEPEESTDGQETGAPSEGSAPVEPEPSDDETPKQGFFSRMLSWLAGIFGT